MDALDYVEKKAEATLKATADGYDGLHERAFKLVAYLGGGGAATLAWVLNKLPNAPAMAWVPLAFLALWWFYVAGGLLLAVKTQELRAGVLPQSLLARYDHEVAYPKANEPPALDIVRRLELDLMDERQKHFSNATAVRADALDLAYKQTVIGTPFVAVLVLAYTWAFTSV